MTATHNEILAGSGSRVSEESPTMNDNKNHGHESPAHNSIHSIDNMNKKKLLKQLKFDQKNRSVLIDNLRNESPRKKSFFAQAMQV